MKKISMLFILVVLIMNMSTLVFANEENPNLDITILSPNGIKDYPGHEDVVQVEITNHGLSDLNQVLVYITMVDLNKNMTVNLEDYSADKPVYIESIKAGDSQIIDLPIRFVYTSKYHLYVTVVTKDSNVITSSKAIPIEILGNTKINKPLAMEIALSEPIILLGIVVVFYGMRRRKYKVKRV